LQAPQDTPDEDPIHIGTLALIHKGKKETDAILDLKMLVPSNLEYL
jgi:hypothetical protein